jgi:hypothetical protein
MLLDDYTNLKNITSSFCFPEQITEDQSSPYCKDVLSELRKRYNHCRRYNVISISKSADCEIILYKRRLGRQYLVAILNSFSRYSISCREGTLFGCESADSSSFLRYYRARKRLLILPVTWPTGILSVLKVDFISSFFK